MTYEPYKFRQRVRFEYLYKGKSRSEYVGIVKRMGITDICECVPFTLVSSRRRANSGVNGITECRVCEGILYPLMYMYACDECTEPALAEVSYLPVSIDFICDNCAGF
jgi:hypothetical protein